LQGCGSSKSTLDPKRDQTVVEVLHRDDSPANIHAALIQALQTRAQQWDKVGLAI
jgi:hypothetical protein